MKTFTRFLFLLLPVLSYGQNPWQFIPEENVKATDTRLVVPNIYKTLNVSTSQLKDILATAPHEQDVNANESEAILDLPMPDGSFKAFRIVKYDMMEKELADAFPEITNYYGRGVRNPLDRIRLNYTVRGLHAVMTTETGQSHVDPYSMGNVNDYVAYWRKDLPNSEPPQCFVTERMEAAAAADSPQETNSRAGDCVFRSYRLAVATTGEYSNVFGATSIADEALVLSEVNTAINRVNEVFERDFSVRFILINETTDVFYYDGTTDPFTNGDRSAVIGENQTNMDAVIGTANYDVGHAFMLNGGGLASGNSVCGSNKARGVSGGGASLLSGDIFYIDLVSHELGHQFGCRHTFNNSCSGNRSDPNAFEPGSGSTIMSYAGTCAPGVQSTKDAYFHGNSVEQATTFISTGNGDSCDTPISSSNTNPTITAVSDYTIPISTPFVLTTTGSDADPADVLTYNWEQFDNAVATMPPLSTNNDGPMFRTFFATESPSRYFPRLEDLTANVSPEWEVLSSVSRDLNFRCTVRDNGTPNGCNDQTNMIVTTTSAAGPFLVTSPNSATTHEVGSCLEISWDVANTSVAPVNATTVDIFLSTDGGLTYPTTLLSNVPNNGFTAIETPDIPTTNGRIMVRASDNIFFDISNADFTIQSGAANYDLCATEEAVNICTPDDATFTFTVTSIGNYSGTVNLSTGSLPGSTTAGFSSNPVTPGDQVTLTISNTGGLSEGVYPITINGSASSGNQAVSFDLGVSAGANTPSLTEPADGETDVSYSPTLSWVTDPLINSYDLEIATDAAFGNIVYTATVTTNSHPIATTLSSSTTYYWRLRAENDCGISSYTTPFSFTTHGCITYSATDLPITILDGTTGTYTSTITIPDEGIIEDLNVIGVTGVHDRIKNLRFTLKHDGTDVILLNRPNCKILDSGISVSFDSDSPNANSSIPCPPDDGLTYQPVSSLTIYNNQSIAGDWQFEITDSGANFGGEFQGWSIEVCPDNYVPLPVSLIDFKATPRDNHIHLNWLTAQELNNKGFEVQRRAEEQQRFETIEWVAGAGTTEIEQKYSLDDHEVIRGTTYYYRLKQLDHDGAFEYSKIVSAVIGQPALKAKIFPNPTDHSITVEMNVVDNMVELELVNLHGQILQSMLVSDTRQVVDLSAYPAGVYFVKIVSDREQLVERVVKE